MTVKSYKKNDYGLNECAHVYEDPEAPLKRHADRVNRENVNKFDDVLEKNSINYKITANSVLNIDESGFTAVQNKVTAQKGLICTVQRYAVNTARLARRSDEALGVRISVARIAPSLLDLERAEVLNERLERNKQLTLFLKCYHLFNQPLLEYIEKFVLNSAGSWNKDDKCTHTKQHGGSFDVGRIGLSSYRDKGLWFAPTQHEVSSNLMFRVQLLFAIVFDKVVRAEQLILPERVTAFAKLSALYSTATSTQMPLPCCSSERKLIPETVSAAYVTSLETKSTVSRSFQLPKKYKPFSLFQPLFFFHFVEHPYRMCNSDSYHELYFHMPANWVTCQQPDGKLFFNIRMDPRGNPVAKAKKRGSDTSDTNTHVEKRWSYKDNSTTPIKCAIATKRKALNWRAVFPSH
ncbi:hypothetical protein PR048_008703 [Dryococelus australis]|uniref:Transposase n=1 Tax=Dryococelus australis TaxID=614101 RepID=A0ABQ9HXX8_9NEOP|nr:hypothetical protein PR048_008703 [Dryococelus australis]